MEVIMRSRNDKHIQTNRRAKSGAYGVVQTGHWTINHRAAATQLKHSIPARSLAATDARMRNNHWPLLSITRLARGADTGAEEESNYWFWNRWTESSSWFKRGIFASGSANKDFFYVPLLCPRRPRPDHSWRICLTFDPLGYFCACAHIFWLIVIDAFSIGDGTNVLLRNFCVRRIFRLLSA